MRVTGRSGATWPRLAIHCTKLSTKYAFMSVGAMEIQAAPKAHLVIDHSAGIPPTSRQCRSRFMRAPAEALPAAECCRALGAACGFDLPLHSILTLALAFLRPLTFLQSGTCAPSRWDRRDCVHMTAALPVCRLDQRQFEHRTRRLQSRGLRGAFMAHSFRAFAKLPGAALTCLHNNRVCCILFLHFVVGFLCAATNIRAPRTYRNIPHGLRTSPRPRDGIGKIVAI